MTTEQAGPFLVERYTKEHPRHGEREMVRVTGTETGRMGEWRADIFDRLTQERGIEATCRSVLCDAEHHRSRAADHVWHVWMNRHMEGQRWDDPESDKSLYEWKRAVGEMERLPTWLKRAREGALPTTHQQCSHQPVEQLPENRLICALGVEAMQCPILRSFYANWAEELDRKYPDGSPSYYGELLTLEDADRVAARICSWHILTQTLKRPYTIDTSEGYMQDEGDRTYWRRVYESMDYREGDAEAAE